MEKCALCKTNEIALYENGIPVCLKCSEEREVKRKPPATEAQIRAILTNNLAKAKVRASEACETFNEIMDKLPSGLPHPDGTQRIHNASRELSIARKEMMKAHHRLYDYLGRGIVPEDLKRSG